VTARRLPAWAPRLLTPAEAGELCGIKPDALRKRAVAGRLRYVQVWEEGGRRYYAEDIEAIVASGRGCPP
jgi:predicted site-specific integrase-resolvase